MFRLAVILCGACLISVASAKSPDFYSGFHDVPALVNVYHYKVPKKMLKARLEKVEKRARRKSERRIIKTSNSDAVSTFTTVRTSTLLELPKLYLFDKKGRQIFAKTGDVKNLGRTLDRAFSTSEPMQDGKRINARLDALVPDGSASQPAPTMTGRFTVLEYWAPWCTYCFTERDNLLAYFRKHPKLRVNWITVDDDITKVTNAKFSHKSTK
jgi:thiol-disulfide isomerase/thioredoxin